MDDCDRQFLSSARVTDRTVSLIQRAIDLLPIIDEMRMGGCTSLAGLARELNLKGWTTSRGCTWDATQVRRLLGVAATK